MGRRHQHDLRGNFLALKYQIPHLIPRAAALVVTASSNAVATDAGRAAYSAAKSGLVAMVQSAALDYADNKIRVNTLIPGTTNTEFVRRAGGAITARRGLGGDGRELGEGECSRPEADGNRGRDRRLRARPSDDFPYMTGAQMVIDGGKTAHA